MEKQEMRVSKTDSGLLVASNPVPAKPPPEHPVREVIRDWLHSLPCRLAGFEQTTHGHLVTERDIGDVLRRVAEAYESPSAYTISTASQAIEQFRKREARDASG
jgi:hypothetical protein